MALLLMMSLLLMVVCRRVSVALEARSRSSGSEYVVIVVALTLVPRAKVDQKTMRLIIPETVVWAPPADILCMCSHVKA